LCLKYCADALTDSTSLCQVEVGALWACWLDVASREGCQANEHVDCWYEERVIESCVASNGGCYFWTAPSCAPLDNSPDPPTCECEKDCALEHPIVPIKPYRVECASDFTVSQCHCYRGVELLGTCEEGPQAICDVWASCCNQFFTDLYPYSAQ
jgi:hypothetical protein